jgi:hypothetical protein
MHVCVTPCGKILSVYKPQFPVENSYSKTVKTFRRFHVKTKQKRKNMADCSNLLREMLGSSICRNLLSRTFMKY